MNDGPAGAPWRRTRRGHGQAFPLPRRLHWGARTSGGGIPRPQSGLGVEVAKTAVPQGRSRRLAGAPRGHTGLPLCGRPGPEQCRSARVRAGPPTCEQAQLRACRAGGPPPVTLPSCLPNPQPQPPKPGPPDGSLAPTEPGGLRSEVCPPRLSFPTGIMQVEATPLRRGFGERERNPMRGAGPVGGVSLENQSWGGHGSGMKQVWAQTSAPGLKTSAARDSMSRPSDRGSGVHGAAGRAGRAGGRRANNPTARQAVGGGSCGPHHPCGAGPLSIPAYSGETEAQSGHATHRRSPS